MPKFPDIPLDAEMPDPGEEGGAPTGDPFAQSVDEAWQEMASLPMASPETIRMANMLARRRLT